jgi:hypothetical protein
MLFVNAARGFGFARLLANDFFVFWHQRSSEVRPLMQATTSTRPELLRLASVFFLPAPSLV